MSLTDYIGYFAATLTTIAYIPQAYKVYKSKQTEDLSLGLFLLLSVGVFMWLIYGFLILSYPVIVANALTLVLSSYILYSKLSHSKKRE